MLASRDACVAARLLSAGIGSGVAGDLSDCRYEEPNERLQRPGMGGTCGADGLAWREGWTSLWERTLQDDPRAGPTHLNFAALAVCAAILTRAIVFGGSRGIYAPEESG
jgi:hypothetical protein